MAGTSVNGAGKIPNVLVAWAKAIKPGDINQDGVDDRKAYLDSLVQQADSLKLSGNANPVLKSAKKQLDAALAELSKDATIAPTLKQVMAESDRRKADFLATNPAKNTPTTTPPVIPLTGNDSNPVATGQTKSDPASMMMMSQVLKTILNLLQQQQGQITALTNRLSQPTQGTAGQAPSNPQQNGWGTPPMAQPQGQAMPPQGPNPYQLANQQYGGQTPQAMPQGQNGAPATPIIINNYIPTPPNGSNNSGNQGGSWNGASQTSPWNSGNQGGGWGGGSQTSPWGGGNQGGGWGGGSQTSPWNSGNQGGGWGGGSQTSPWSSGNQCGGWGGASQASTWNSGNQGGGWGGGYTPSNVNFNIGFSGSGPNGGLTVGYNNNQPNGQGVKFNIQGIPITT
jgi:hypothetical protein